MMVLLNYGDWKKTVMTPFESNDINLNSFCENACRNVVIYMKSSWDDMIILNEIH